MSTERDASNDAYLEAKAVTILEREFFAFCSAQRLTPRKAVEPFANQVTRLGTRNYFGFGRLDIATRLFAALGGDSNSQIEQTHVA